MNMFLRIKRGMGGPSGSGRAGRTRCGPLRLAGPGGPRAPRHVTFGVSRDAREARRVAPRARTHRHLVERRPRGSAAAPARRPAARRGGGGGDARTTPAASPGRKAGARRARARPRRGRLPVPRELRGEGNHAESRRHLFRYLLILLII